ncbi:hypothetical protein WN51_10061 [Melipona quadrifasciata]|uniref:Uncharacterized protein n=1 Tax=Melipona quadrifasciata TaxID=166423 RepID=A0A0M9ACM7_9HYME|nr:hypothetical protein WN51_10061 [Melipona quadrifasciata]
MYKTVRKGDTCLEYKILPQTDHFSSSGSPRTSKKSDSSRTCCIIRNGIITLMILFLLGCLSLPFFMKPSDRQLLIKALFKTNALTRNFTRSQEKDIGANKSKSKVLVTTTMIPSTELYRKQDVENQMTTVSELLNADEQESEEFTITDSSECETSIMQIFKYNEMLIIEHTTTSTQRSQTSTESSMKQTSTTSPLTSTSMWSTSLRMLTSSPSDVIKTSSSAPLKKTKMPRVTLKLRENETIPQMYMKAGIASYKKGNITTSVLAHGLSLEGLIFKTPEGTINPWPQKWFFTDPSSSDFQWKVQSSRQKKISSRIPNENNVKWNRMKEQRPCGGTRHGLDPKNTYEFINRNFLFDNLLGIESLLEIRRFNRHNAENHYHMELVNWGLNQMPIRIYIVLAVFAALASISISLLLYVQRKAIKRQRQCIEEAGVEGHEEDKSILLGVQETEEKDDGREATSLTKFRRQSNVSVIAKHKSVAILESEINRKIDSDRFWKKSNKRARLTTRSARDITDAMEPKEGMKALSVPLPSASENRSSRVGYEGPARDCLVFSFCPITKGSGSATFCRGVAHVVPGVEVREIFNCPVSLAGLLQILAADRQILCHAGTYVTK